MAKGDVFPFESASSHGMGGAITMMVASGTTASINAGEPVEKTTGATGVIAAATSMPTTTLRIAGISTSASTETASAVGFVQVVPPIPGQLWLCAAQTAATWNTQTKYNNLVGSQVLFNLTTGVYTVAAVHGTGNGLTVEWLDIARYPALVCFSINMNTAYNAF